MRTPDDRTKEELIRDLTRLRSRISDLEKSAEDKRKYQDELTRARAMFEGLFEFAPDAIIVVGTDGLVVRANKQAERLFGYSRDELLALRVEDLLPERFREAHVRHRGDYMSAPHIRPMGTGLDLYGRRKDREEFSVDIALGPLRIDDGMVVLAVIRDVSERRKAESALRCAHDELEQRVLERTAELRKANSQLHELAVHLQSVREDERTGIAREIHDELGQFLTALKIDLSWLKSKLGSGQQALLDKAQADLELIDAIIASVKRICTELRPEILDSMGLEAAIAWQAEDFQKRTGIRCEVNLGQKPLELSMERKTALFRIFQEILTNIVRHARATSVTVSLGREDGGAKLEVRDNGVGIVPEQALKPDSFGLLGMRERVSPWGGSIEINGGPNNGTTVKAVVPMD